jgi:hypothetical protein
LLALSVCTESGIAIWSAFIRAQQNKYMVKNMRANELYFFLFMEIPHHSLSAVFGCSVPITNLTLIVCGVFFDLLISSSFVYTR